MVQERYETANVDGSILGDSLKLGSRTAPSRFLKGAMTERLSSWDQHQPEKRGIPSKELIKLYEAWGAGGFGVILSGNTMVNPIDLEAPGNPTFGRGQDEPEREAAFKALATNAKKHGALFVVQLSHGGRQVSENINPNPVSASDVQLQPTMGMTFAKPTPLTKEGIKDVVDQFAHAAEYAKKIGADGIQLHGAHGYLLAQFLSSTTNQRTDEYGGSLENRSRIIFEIVDEIKRRIPEAGTEFVLGIKINSVEFQNGGFQPEECKEVCEKLTEQGVSLIELSGGTYQSLAFAHKRDSSKKREAFFLEFADVIRPSIKNGAKIFVTGGFRTTEAMVEAIKNGSTDGIGLARPVTEEPNLPTLLITNKVPSSRKTLLDEQDFGITNVASGTQMRQIGRGLTPFNTTDEKQKGEFLSTVQEFFQKAKENGEAGIVEAGYPILG